MIERSDIPQSKYGVARRFACSCCPYGYHIDLDFVKYCETLHRTPPISRRVRSARRQRHSMDIMMGFISVPEPTPAPTKNTEYDSICATDALADAVCNFEMTLLSAAVKTEAKIAEPEPEGGRSALEYAREQMAQHLGRIRSLEEQLKVIPALRLQIDMLTEEKRRLEGRLLLSPKLSCRRDVGSQCIGIGQENAYTNTERIAMIPKQLQCSPNIESRLTQTAAIVTYTRATSTEAAVAVQSVMRDASTLTDMQVLTVEPEAVAVIPSINIATQTFAHQSTDKYQQTDLSVVSRGLQCDIRPATVEVRMQTIDPIVIYAETQTPSQELSCSETQTEEIIFDVSEDSEMEDEDNESLKSPLSAINEDTEERETYTSATTHDSDNSIDEAPIVTPSREMLAALETIGDALERQIDVQSLPHANATLRREWFHVASTEGATAASVRAYLEAFRAQSSAVVEYMATLADANGNTALHYAISHGNFPVVGALLDSGACDVNRCNNAGYTAIMLVSLVALTSMEAKRVVERLFRVADVNLRARKHGQTALMLAVSHGNVNMVAMLIAAGADVNAQDEDGSTALMCAVEHGKMDIVKVLLAQPQCDSSIQDMDGSTALKISLDAGFHDIGILLYAHNRASKHRNGAT